MATKPSDCQLYYKKEHSQSKTSHLNKRSN